MSNENLVILGERETAKLSKSLHLPFLDSVIGLGTLDSDGYPTLYSVIDSVDRNRRTDGLSVNFRWTIFRYTNYDL